MVCKNEVDKEMLAALKLVERYLVERGIEYRGTVGRLEVLPAVRKAIALAEGERHERILRNT